MEIPQLKSDFRQNVFHLLAQTDTASFLQAGKAVADKILPLLQSHASPGKGVGLFKSFSDEISTLPLQGLLAQNEIPCFFPRTKPDYTMHFYDTRHNEAVTPEEIAVLIVPGVAFDRFGNRMGRGKGFYDRFLAGIPPKKFLTIGIGMDFQLFEQIPVDSNDQSVNMICTPSFEIIL